jgi:hypothetical protein
LDIPLICPKCNADTLKIVSSIELPPDSRSDEIAVQITGCSRCNFIGLAVYEESRRGSLINELFTHRGYNVSPTALETIQQKIAQCPNPRNSKCHCKVHHTMGRADSDGRWIGLDVLTTKTYNIRHN